MANWEQPKNNGWTDVDYDFGLEPESAARVNNILNEACHVFYCHAEGVWASSDKNTYASLLAEEFKQHPKLSGRVIRSKDRVVKMVAFRALEIIKEQDSESRAL